jgi:hypothetical protein
MRYKTANPSIPMDFGEPIYFFPLGSDPSADNPHIELLLTLYRYGEEPQQVEPVPEGTTPAVVPETGAAPK